MLKQICAWMVWLPIALYWLIFIYDNMDYPPVGSDSEIYYHYTMHILLGLGVGFPLLMWYRWKDGTEEKRSDSVKTADKGRDEKVDNQEVAGI
jgi:hypothetical protein